MVKIKPNTYDIYDNGQNQVKQQENLYEVYKIAKRRKRRINGKKVLQYKVIWSDYYSYNWIPFEDLYCSYLLNEYYKSKKQIRKKIKFMRKSNK